MCSIYALKNNVTSIHLTLVTNHNRCFFFFLNSIWERLCQIHKSLNCLSNVLVNPFHCMEGSYYGKIRSESCIHDGFWKGNFLGLVKSTHVCDVVLSDSISRKCYTCFWRGIQTIENVRLNVLDYLICRFQFLPVISSQFYFIGSAIYNELVIGNYSSFAMLFVVGQEMTVSGLMFSNWIEYSGILPFWSIAFTNAYANSNSYQ